MVTTAHDFGPGPNTHAEHGGIPLAALRVAVRGFERDHLLLDRPRRQHAVLKTGSRPVCFRSFLPSK